MTEQNTTGPQPCRSAESTDAAPATRDDCEYAQRISAYHDGEVSETEARELAHHVAGCPACATQLAFFGRVSSTFEAAPASHLSPGARQRLEALGDQFQPDHAKQPGRLPIKPSADVRWVRRLTAAAAILFVVAAGKVVYDQKFTSNDKGNLMPANNPHEPVGSPAVTDTGFEAARLKPKPSTTGQTEKP